MGVDGRCSWPIFSPPILFNPASGLTGSSITIRKQIALMSSFLCFLFLTNSGPSSLPHSTATLYSNNVSTSSISSATGKHATTTRPLNSESARANLQHWTMTLTVMATFICLFLRCPEVDKKCQQEFYRILDDAFTVPKARAPVSLTCYVGLKNPRWHVDKISENEHKESSEIEL